MWHCSFQPRCRSLATAYMYQVHNTPLNSCTLRLQYTGTSSAPLPSICLLLFLLPSDNVQHDLQRGSLITFPKEENLGNNRKPMHQVYLPSVPTFTLSTLFAVFAPSFSLLIVVHTGSLAPRYRRALPSFRTHSGPSRRPVVSSEAQDDASS